ncbi:centromere protein J isoform X2 [Plutella xylostella]|uniref:centromere protein J isoform X2 n=1 Tax=Plutella xylostella TaxID=51655 RepID=UPI002032CE7E|nr:centromere protein J isoform X2 [Plutella xylostella]
MDHSVTDSDASFSPQLLERLQLLHQMQLLQREKLLKHRLQYQESPGSSPGLTEVVSHFTNSTSYNTFQTLLQSTHGTANDSTPRSPHDVSAKIKDQDLIEGVSVLNLSRESEFIVTSPTSTRSQVTSKVELISAVSKNHNNNNVIEKSELKKHIGLDEVQILSPRKDFETMLLEKLREGDVQRNENVSVPNKRPFLRRGEGMARFGLRKNDLVIQNTQALPWRKKSSGYVSNTQSNKSKSNPKKTPVPKTIVQKDTEQSQELIPPNSKLYTEKAKLHNKVIPLDNKMDAMKINQKNINIENKSTGPSSETTNSSSCEVHNQNNPIIKLPTGDHPLKTNRGKTWAAILTKEQDEFLRQLKQSDYYKNFTSPAKSIASDMSCDDQLNTLRVQKEAAEQNMFDLLENKVTSESFNIESSFFNKFLRKSQLECSGESTPLILQKCLASNPNLLHIFPGPHRKKVVEETQSDVETCNSDCSECDHEACSSVSTCCSCKTVEETNQSHSQEENHRPKNEGTKKLAVKEVKHPQSNDKWQEDVVTENDTLKANIVEMNTKLVATSDLLKERLKELEDEIDTFRKENANLAKMREEVDLERQKFYEEKAAFEQKFNEEKILSEYYLAEEKEKLSKQKQIYDKYVREIRGRLNKKDKDEVINLKREISDLKDEIKVKDAKSTSSIARLRNQLKIMEKEKKTLNDEIEKLKKENRRLNHSNEMTRRMSNIKYLEQINKKLSSITPKESRTEVQQDEDIKYKAYEIERQSRGRRVQLDNKNTMRPRAKSVPNLKVTSRYAKYFSQKDSVSEMVNYNTINNTPYSHYSDDDDDANNERYNNHSLNLEDNECMQYEEEANDNEVENNLEKMYVERFKSNSPNSSKSSISHSSSTHSLVDKPDSQTKNGSNGFFLRKSYPDSERNTKSPPRSSTSPYLQTSSESNRSKSPVSILTNRCRDQRSSDHQTDSSSYTSRSKSPVSILSNRSSTNQRLPPVVFNKSCPEVRTIEPTISKTSLNKTSLNPTEIKRPDGTRELQFPNGNVKFISPDGKYTKFVYYNGDVKENFYSEGRIKYYYSESKTFHTTHPDGLEVLEFPDGQTEKRYKDGSTEIRLPNGSVRYHDPKNPHVTEEWRFPDGTTMTVSASGEQRVVFSNGQVEVHAKDHRRREFPDGTVKLVYADGTSETRYASGRVRVKDQRGNLIMDSAPG